MIRASESGHWYDRDGTPRYEIEAKDGSMRAATLRDARKFGWYPGVTSIIKCAAAPGIEKYKEKQVLMAALTMPRDVEWSEQMLSARIMADAGEHAKKAREWGTNFHAAIQGHYEGKAPSGEWWECVKGVAELLRQNCGMQPWVAEKPCAHPSGFGTKADLHTPCYLLDFKGKEFTKETIGELKTWDEHAMQLAATRKALGLPQAECGIVYVSRVDPGLCRLIRVEEPELIKGWEMFQALLAYWKASKGYYPERWQEKEAA
jgi:hypothetical protein